MFLFCQSRFCCKIVSFVVLQSFLVLDMAWAADNNGYSKNNPDCLSPEISIASPLFFQQYRKGVNTLESQNVGLPFEISTPKVSFGTSGWRWDEYQDYTDKNGNFKQEEFLNDFYASIIASAEQIKQQEQANPGRTGVIIGGDTRAVGPYSNLDLTNMAAEIFASMGVRVIKADHYLPLPAVSCLIKHLNAAGSVYFTASHNPGKGYSVVREDGSTMQINNDGIKFNPADSGPAGEEITKPLSERANELRAFKQSSAFDAQKHARNIEVLTLQKAAPLYIEALREVIDFDAIKNGFAKGTLDYIVFDTKHGSAVEYYRLIMRMLGLREGIDFEVINSEFDPSFTQMVDPETGEMRPDRPEPDAKYSKHLISRVSRLNAEGKKVIGIACDVDADRNGIVDAGGTFLDPNMTLAIESQYVLQQTFRQWLMEHNPGLAGRLDAFVNTASEMDGLREAVEQFVNDGNVGIAKTIPTSNMLNAIAQLWGCRLEETKVGFKWFRPHLLPGSSKPVLIAGEESQGLNLRSQSQDPAYVVLEKDALTAGLKMLEIVTKTGRSPEQLAGKLQDVIGYFVYQRGGVDLRSKTTPDKIDELKAALKKQLDFLKTLTQSAMITEIGGKKSRPLFSMTVINSCSAMIPGFASVFPVPSRSCVFTAKLRQKRWNRRKSSARVISGSGSSCWTRRGLTICLPQCRTWRGRH
jgi:Phosphoglucomutase